MRSRAAPRVHGAALLLVLWVLALATVLIGGFALVARAEQLEARHLAEGARARYAAEAGLSRAVYEMMRPAVENRWVADGRAYSVEFDEAKIEVRVQDEAGKLDINAADAPTLAQLFQIFGVELDRAEQIADAVMDWRDSDDLVHPKGAELPEYEAAELDYGPTNLPFGTVDEFQQVLGIGYELFRKLRPFLTVHSRAPRPAFALAPPELLQLIPGVTGELARDLVQQREQFGPNDPRAQTLLLPDGTPLLTGGGSGTYTVRSSATLGNGMRSGLTTVVRLGGAPGARAYTALEWRLGNYD